MKKRIKEKFERINENSVLYNDTYILCRNGDIIAPSGRILKKYNFAYPYSHVTMFIGDKVIKQNAAILIYKAFSEEGTSYNVYKNGIQFLDNDSNNTAFENLRAIPKSVITKNSSYGKQFKQNVLDDYNKGELSIRQLAEKYQCSLGSVQKFIGFNYQQEYRKRVANKD